MNYIDKKLEEFDEKFPNPIYDETEIGDDSETNRKLKSFLKQALEEQERELFNAKLGDTKRIIDISSGKELVWRLVEINEKLK
jgi:hypothetical protein